MIEARDHAWQRPGDQQPAERADETPLLPETQRSARCGRDVEQQVGRRDRRARHAEHAELDR
jgi:hypothetical protein